MRIPHIYKLLLKNRYWLLLVALMLQITLPVFFDKSSLTYESLRSFVLVLFFIACVNFIRQFKMILKLMIVLAIVAAGLHMVQISYASINVQISALAFMVVFLILIFGNLLKQLFRLPEVDLDAVSGVAAGYLLLGFLSTTINSLVLMVDQDAFNWPLEGKGGTFIEMAYYSFVSLTTIGFGDIVPVSKAARMLTVLFSVIGQMYIAIVIALMVSKYIATGHQKNRNSKA